MSCFPAIGFTYIHIIGGRNDTAQRLEGKRTGRKKTLGAKRTGAKRPITVLSRPCCYTEPIERNLCNNSISTMTLAQVEHQCTHKVNERISKQRYDNHSFHETSRDRSKAEIRICKMWAKLLLHGQICSNDSPLTLADFVSNFVIILATVLQKALAAAEILQQ